MVDDYSVIESDNMGELVEAICEAMRVGWQCQGGICIWYEAGRMLMGDPIRVEDSIVHYAQALVR